MEAASVAAFAVVAPLTISGYAHIKDCLRTSGTRVGAAPTLFKDAFVDPRQQLRIVETKGNSLGGNVTLSVDGQPVGSYLVFNGEIILVGDNPNSLKAVAAIGGAKVTSQAQTVSVVAWEAPRELKLQFSSEKEAGEWAKALREAAKLPQYPARMDMLMDHIHMQDMHKTDLQHRVEKAQEERLALERKLEEAPSKHTVAELEAKVRETSSALHSNKARADAVEEALKEQKQLLMQRENLIQQAEVGTVYRVESNDPTHKANHHGLAYRRSMNLEDKIEELALWGTTVKGIDVGNGWVQVGEKFLPVAVGSQYVLTPSDAIAGSFQEHVANLNRDLQLALQKKEEAEGRHQVSVQQVQDLKHAVARVATAGGHQELLDLLHAAEANTSGASRELLEMFEAAEVRKLDLEERARALEERLACLESRGQLSPEPAAQEASAGFVPDAAENEDHVRMLEMAEARRTQLEDRTREIEMQIARIEQMREQELQESPKAAETAALTARISQLEAALLEKDQDVQQHLHHLEGEKRAEAQRLLARAAQLEAACTERQRQAEELRAQLAEATSHQANGHGEAAFEDGLQAMMLHAAEVHGRAQAQASQAHEAATVFERHATELDRLRRISDEAAPEEAGGAAPGELRRLRAEAAAAARDAEAARAERQASLRRAAEAEARAGELEGALAAKEGLVAELIAGAEQRDQEITKLAQALEVQQPPTEVVAPQLQNNDMEELCQRASLAEAKVAELSAFIQDQDAQAVQLSATLTAMEEEIVRLRSAQSSPDVEELRASIEEREAERVQLLAGVTAMEQEIMQLQAQVAAHEERSRDVQLAGVHEELTNRAADAEAKAADFEDLAIKRGEELTRMQALVEGTEQELTNRIAHAEARATEFEELAFKRKEELMRVKAMAAETEQEILHLQAEVAAHEAQSNDRKPVRAHEELTNMLTLAQARAAEFEELAMKREEELSQLKVTAAEMDQELAQRTDAERRAIEFEELAFTREEELAQLTETIAGMEQELNHRAHGESKATEFQELAATREEELFQLKEAVAAMEQELTRRADADTRAVEFEELAIRREEELAQLKETIAGMEQELTHRAHGESRATEFQELAARKEEELLQLKEAVATMEQEVTHRTTYADRRATEFEELAIRREGELTQLKDAAARMEQELTLLRSSELQSANQAAALEAHMQTAKRAEETAAHFRALADEKARHAERFESSTGALQQELTLLRSSELQSANQAAALEAQLQQMQEDEANALAARALIQEKDLQVSQLQQDVNSLEQELANLQAQQAGAHQVGQEALVQQTALTEAHMQTAKRAEETAAHFRALADEKARHAERFESSTGALQQELAQLRQAVARRAEEDAAGRQGLLEQARAAEDIARAEGRQERVDEVRAREEQRAKRFEEEKIELQRQLEAQFEVQYAAVKRHATEAQQGFEASCLERDALKSQLEQAQAKDEQRNKFFEEEQATLRRHLAVQFETEYSAIQRKATEAEVELRNLFLERDSLKKKLEQAPAAERELPAAVVQRLASTEIAAEEAKARLQLAEQELRVAYQTIERQSQEHAQLHSRRSQAPQLEAQLAQLEQEKLALQEQLAQRTAVYNRELEDVRLKMKLLEEALMTASGVSPAQAQASLESLSIASKPHAAEHARAVLVDTPTSRTSRHGFGDDLPGAIQQPPEVTSSLNVIPSIQVTSPPQLHRYTAEAMQQPQLGATAAAAGVVTAHGFVGGQQPQATAGPPPVPISSMVSPVTTVSPMPSFAGSMQGGSLQASAAPLQSLVLPTGAPSPMQLRAQEPLGAGPMLPCAAWQMQTASPLVSPMRQRPQEPNPAAATAVVMQRAASPAMQRPLQPTAAPAPPVFAMQAAGARPTSRASFAAPGPPGPGPLPVAAAAQPRVASARGAPVPALAAQPPAQAVAVQGLPATIRQLSGTGSWSGHSHLDKLTPPTAERGSRQLMADLQTFPRSPNASFDPSAMRQVPMATSLRSDSGATLSASMAQAPEVASLLQPAAPYGGIIGSLSPTSTDFQSMRN